MTSSIKVISLKSDQERRTKFSRPFLNTLSIAFLMQLMEEMKRK